MEDNLEGIGISSDDDQLSDTAVECLGGLIGTLLNLLQRSALGNQVEEFGGEILSSKGLGALGDFLNQDSITIIVEKDYKVSQIISLFTHCRHTYHTPIHPT